MWLYTKIAFEGQITSSESRVVIGGNSSKSLCLLTNLPLFLYWLSRKHGNQMKWLCCCSHFIPAFICVASVSTDSPRLPALHSETQNQAANRTLSRLRCQDSGELPSLGVYPSSCIKNELITSIIASISRRHRPPPSEIVTPAPPLSGVTSASLLRALMRSGSIQPTKTQTFLPLAYTK